MAALKILLLMTILFAIGCGNQPRFVASVPFQITTTTLPDSMATFPFSQNIQATGGVSPLAWSISSGTLPHGLSLAASNSSTVTIQGTPDTPGIATFTVTASDGAGQHASQPFTINVKDLATIKVQPISGNVPMGTVELQGAGAGSFNATAWQNGTLNWVSDVRMPVLAPRPGTWENIYSPWALEQPNGWRLFYGGWDGTDTPNDRVYSALTSDFLTFTNRTLVIDHGAFEHVNNTNVHQLSDGSLHMICTILQNDNSLDKPAYFSSPDGITWNGTPEPYQAQLSDVVSVPDDASYAGNDYNGGNVLLWDNNQWVLYYSVGVFGGTNGKVFKATSATPPVFQSAGSVLNTSEYANDVRKFQSGGQNWYVMLLYTEEVTFGTVSSPTFSYSLSNDGAKFGAIRELFGPASIQDRFLTTPALITQGNTILGVMYGGNPVDLLNAQDSIFAQWLQKKVVLQDSSGTQYAALGSYGPNRQWFSAPPSGAGPVTISVYAEDGVTPLGRASATLVPGTAYQLVTN